MGVFKNYRGYNNPPWEKRWRLYILPQCLANLTQPTRHKESQIFTRFVSVLRTLSSSSSSGFVKFLYVFMNVVKVRSLRTMGKCTSCHLFSYGGLLLLYRKDVRSFCLIFFLNDSLLPRALPRHYLDASLRRRKRQYMSTFREKVSNMYAMKLHRNCRVLFNLVIVKRLCLYSFDLLK